MWMFEIIYPLPKSNFQTIIESSYACAMTEEWGSTSQQSKALLE
jgi:hypothetical protein